jgi:hypothetical protein
MFSYYGSKSKIAHLYPPPKFETVIEPFAGSAKYALLHWKKEVILCDLSPLIVRVWKYLQQASKTDILGLPRLKRGESLKDFELSKEETEFLGFVIAPGNAYPRFKMSPFGAKHAKSKNGINTIEYIASNLHRIKHWQVYECDYRALPNINATWFVDPPYQRAGYKYPFNKIDYSELAQWITDRNGQTIACEQYGADWMNFKPLAKLNGTSGTTMEAIWSNMPTNYDYQQMKMF